MSNSPLVSHTNISPNKSVNRTHKIDTITIHCVVGQLSVETIGNIFASPTRGASSNYGIGYDGKIGMYCEEKDRSWCSGGRDKNGNPIKINGISGSENDQRAITIEVASDTKHPYAVNDKAYAALIDLLVDICQRNEIKKLLWKADKSLVGKIDQQNMTVHRWFSTKACPGDFLYERHGQIADEVNARLGISKVEESTKPTTSNNNNSSNELLVYNWLKKNSGLNTAAISGILANLYAESGFISTNLQNTYEKSLGYTDASYTAAVDDGSYTNFVRDSAGYGLAQWTYWSRKQGLLDHVNSKKTSIGDYVAQLEYLMKELKSYKKVWEQLSTSADTEEAAYKCGYVFCSEFEKPANKDNLSIKRGNSAKEYFRKYKGNSTDESASTSLKFEDIEIGDILEFIGSQQYISAVAPSGTKASPSRVKVTRKYKASAEHPIHVRSVDSSGNYTKGIYGWVDLKDLEELESTPYKVKVTATSLNYRKGPGTQYTVLGTIKDQGVYTIVQEIDGWGQLKSKVGWINLSYTKRI